MVICDEGGGYLCGPMVQCMSGAVGTSLTMCDTVGGCSCLDDTTGPLMMQALVARHYGPYDQVLAMDSIRRPELPGMSTEVLIQVAYSDVNPVDLQKLLGGPRRGQAVGKDKVFVSGYGGSGRILHVGDQVPASAQLRMGSRVCFLGKGSYAETILVDYRCVAIIPESISLKHAAVVAFAGCTAFETLTRMGFGPNNMDDDPRNQGFNTDGINVRRSQTRRRLLIVGAAGGVGSWAITLARAWNPGLEIVCTVTSKASSDWCMLQGANGAVHHSRIATLGGNYFDAVLCLAEPTPAVFQALSDVTRPYGKICLVVGGKSIHDLDLSVLFLKSISVLTETVFSSIRTKYQFVEPNKEIQLILQLMAQKKVRVPLSPQLENVSTDWKTAHKKGGVLDIMASAHTRGKLFLTIADYL